MLTPWGWTVLVGTSWSGTHALPDPFQSSAPRSHSDAFTASVEHTQCVAFSTLHRITRKLKRNEQTADRDRNFSNRHQVRGGRNDGRGQPRLVRLPRPVQGH